MLHDSPDLVIHRTEIWVGWRSQVGRKKVWRLLTQQFNCCTCATQCAGALSCWNKVVTRHCAYRWQQYDVIMTSWSSIKKSLRDITRISCFVTIIKPPHALQVYSTVVVKKLSIYNSFPVIQTTIAKNRHFYVPRPSFSVCPGDAPATITQYVAWMERQFSACQTARSMYPSIFNSFRVIRCLSQCVSPKIAIFTTLFPLGTPLGQSR